MIQRIQTIFLLLAVGFSMPLYYVPLGTVDAVGDNRSASFFIYGVMENLQGEVITFTIPLFLLLVLSSVAIFVTILLFRNRRRQILFCRFILLDMTILQGMVFYYARTLNSLFPGERLRIEPWAFLPLVSMVFLVLAMRAIQKDENLVRSSSRLR